VAVLGAMARLRALSRFGLGAGDPIRGGELYVAVVKPRRLGAIRFLLSVGTVFSLSSAAVLTPGCGNSSHTASGHDGAAPSPDAGLQDATSIDSSSSFDSGSPEASADDGGSSEAVRCG
jgi:hypothetical protein